MYWGLTLRANLQDIRNEIRGLHTRIDEMGSSINVRLDEAAATTNARFEALTGHLDSQFRWMIMAMLGMMGILATLITL